MQTDGKGVHNAALQVALEDVTAAFSFLVLLGVAGHSSLGPYLFDRRNLLRNRVPFSFCVPVFSPPLVAWRDRALVEWVFGARLVCPFRRRGPLE